MIFEKERELVRNLIADLRSDPAGSQLLDRAAEARMKADAAAREKIGRLLDASRETAAQATETFNVAAPALFAKHEAHRLGMIEIGNQLNNLTWQHRGKIGVLQNEQAELEQKLIESADPRLQQFIDHWINFREEHSKHVNINVMTDKRQNVFTADEQVFENNRRAVRHWLDCIAAAIEAARALQLKPDQSDIEAALERLKATIPILESLSSDTDIIAISRPTRIVESKKN